MLPDDLLQELRRKPFRGLRIHVSGGKVYEVHHPELVMVGVSSAVIGIPEKKLAQPVYSSYEVVALSHIIRLEPVEAPSPTSN